jgi:RNA polymerase-binding protein DksA
VLDFDVEESWFVDKEKLNQYKETLNQMRNQVVSQLKEEKRRESLRETSGEHSYSFHIADQGSDCNEHEKTYLIASLEGDILDELDEALDRIDEGSFGKCVFCGNEINEKRLDALPYAKLCLPCKAAEERKNS